jgi:phospholipid/cholesterol/gamma-HCH transport system substrate-binding protein
MAFAVLGAVAISYSGAKYAHLTDLVVSTTYQVQVDLADSGGIFPGAEVTYRGVPIGRVGKVVPAGDGIHADLEIGRHQQVPADSLAEVHNRSAVGEQYVDLIPPDASGPYLHDGSVIARAATSTPLPEQDLLASLNSFVSSVNTHDLSTVVTELGTGFRGTGPDIARLLDGATTLLGQANAHLPETVGLLRNTAVVLRTQEAQADSIRSFTHSLAELTTTVRKKDPQIRTTLRDGASLAHQLGLLLDQLQPSFLDLGQNLAVLARIAHLGMASLAQALVAFPYSVATTGPGARNGLAQFVLQLTQGGPVCQKGYIPPAQWRSTTDLTAEAPDYGVACKDPQKTWRGAAHAP